MFGSVSDGNGREGAEYEQRCMHLRRCRDIMHGKYVFNLCLIVLPN
jgi:hypothetical protein